MIQLGWRSCILFSLSLARLMKMCLNETYSRIQVGINLPDMFHIKNDLKQGNALSPLLFFALEQAIREFR
jgi:hypothetical protein